MAQFVTRVDDRLAASVDELVSAGVVESRSEAVRIGLERLVEASRRRRVGQTIVEGYTRLPQTESEIAWVDEATARMIADEPW